MGHLMIESRNGLIVDARLAQWDIPHKKNPAGGAAGRLR